MSVDQEAQEQALDRVLAIVEYLGNKDHLRLDDVDGAFYWGFVRRNEVDRLFGIDRTTSQRETVRRLLAEPVDWQQFDDVLVRLTQIEALDQDMRTTSPIFADIADRLIHIKNRSGDPTYQQDWELFQADYPDLANWLFLRKPPRMRAPWIRPGGPRLGIFWQLREEDLVFPSANFLTICVPNGEFQGRDLEEFLGSESPFPGYWKEPQPGEEGFSEFDVRKEHGHDLLKIESWLRTSDSSVMGLTKVPLAKASKSGPLPVSFPFVEMRIFAPWPAAGVIGYYYDRMVIEQFRWNEQLQGKLNGQTPIVATRTWAIALLNSAGMNQERAIETVCHRLKIPTIVAPRFVSDRSTLLQRMQVEGLYELVTTHGWTQKKKQSGKR